MNEEKWTESDSEFEQELSSLRPKELSQEFQENLRERLDGVNEPHGLSRPIATNRRWLVPTLTAAALILVLVWLTSNLINRGRSLTGDGSGQQRTTAEVDSPVPSLIAMRRALEHSPEDLTALLDQQANRLLPSVSKPNF